MMNGEGNYTCISTHNGNSFKLWQKKKKNTHAKGSVQEQDLKYVMRLNVTESKNFTKRHLGASK